MKTQDKKLISGLILAFSIMILLATLAYAKPFTEAFKGGLIQINDFFAKEQYKTYAKAIDFFIFSLLFTAIYMRGVKFAFKEVKRTEQLIAVLLGLTTAFLMVLGDYSIVSLLPFLNLFLYFLLFALIWWLLKEMKSKFWRFVLALLLTLLLLLLFQLLFSGILTGISCPEKALPWLNLLFAILIFILLMFLLKDIKNGFGRFILALLLTIVIVLLIIGLLKASSIETKCPEVKSAFAFMGDFTDSLKGIDIGRFSPSTPQFLRDLTLKQVTPPSGLLQQVEPPDQKKDAKEPGLAVGEGGERKPAKPSVQQEQEKSAESLALLFGVYRKGATQAELENDAIVKGKAGKVIGEREESERNKGEGTLRLAYVEEKDKKPVLMERRSRFGRDTLAKDDVVNPEKDSDVRRFTDNERTMFQLPVPPPQSPRFTDVDGEFHYLKPNDVVGKSVTNYGTVYYSVERDNKNKENWFLRPIQSGDAKIKENANYGKEKGVPPLVTFEQRNFDLSETSRTDKIEPNSFNYLQTKDGQNFKSKAPALSTPGQQVAPAQEAPPRGLEPTVTPIKPERESSLPTPGGLSDKESRKLAGEQRATAQAGDSDVPLSQSVPGNMSKYSWIGIVLLVIIFFLGRNMIRKRKKRKEKLTIQDILSRIEEVYKNKKGLIEKLTTSQKRKETLIPSHDNITAFLKKIAEEVEKGEVYWYEEEEKLGEERGSVGGLNEIERQWIAETRELIKLEIEFIKGLREWHVPLGNVKINIEEEYAQLEQLIVRAKDSILVLLLRLYGKETQLEHTYEELLQFLDKGHRAELIREKHKKFLEDAAIVKIYVEEEGRIIRTVGEKIEDQNKLLAQLHYKIREAIKRGISRRAFLAGGVETGLIASTTSAEEQDRKIEIKTAKDTAESGRAIAPPQEVPPKGLEPTITPITPGSRTGQTGELPVSTGGPVNLSES